MTLSGVPRILDGLADLPAGQPAELLDEHSAEATAPPVTAR